MTAPDDEETPKEPPAGKQGSSGGRVVLRPADTGILPGLSSAFRLKTGWLAIDDCYNLLKLALLLPTWVEKNRLSEKEAFAVLRAFQTEGFKLKRFYGTIGENYTGVDQECRLSLVRGAAKWVDDLVDWVRANINKRADLPGWERLEDRAWSLITEYLMLLDFHIAARSARSPVPQTPDDSKPSEKATMTKEEANVRARDLLRETPTWDWTARRLAAQIPCCLGWISGLPAWRGYHEKRKQLRRAGTIKTVSLTDELEAVLGTGDKDEMVNRLIAEQEKEQREDSRQAKLYVSHKKKPDHGRS